jgi:hypothetical protein
LVFRANDAVLSKDGIFTFADIHKPDGTLVPVSVRIRLVRERLPLLEARALGQLPTNAPTAKAAVAP